MAKAGVAALPVSQATLQVVPFLIFLSPRTRICCIPLVSRFALRTLITSSDTYSSTIKYTPCIASTYTHTDTVGPKNFFRELRPPPSGSLSNCSTGQFPDVIENHLSSLSPQPSSRYFILAILQLYFCESPQLKRILCHWQHTHTHWILCVKTLARALIRAPSRFR